MVEKKSKVPRQINVKSKGGGTPNIIDILQAARVESLNHPLTIKLPETLAKYITEGPGPGFVRDAILEKLQRLADKTVKARCDQCVNLTERDGPFCVWLCASFLDYDKKHMDELFHCEGFQRKKETRK